ncbi:MAG: hypothetical protein HY831_03470 [Candidatus Aenigmarchaeota archaeon]|nr:hypothetical protein [Candidatus Aenigmarchaeota archaeon]
MGRYIDAGNTMTTFLANRLEESRLYSIQERDHSHVLAVELEGGRTIYIAAHTSPGNMTLDQLKMLRSEQKEAGRYVGHIFYAGRTVDEKKVVKEREFLRKSKISPQRHRGSLKRYSKDEINRIMDLTEQELYVLDKCGTNKFYGEAFPDGVRRLTYYSPAGRYSEGILIVAMTPVVASYSHVGKGHVADGHVGDGRVLQNERLSNGVRVSFDPVHLELDQYGESKHVIVTSDSSRVKYPPRLAADPQTTPPKPAYKLVKGSLVGENETIQQLNLFEQA